VTTLTPPRPLSPRPGAQVDDRLNGDGAGIAFGVNDPVLGAHLLGVFTTIWALYYVSTQSEVFVKRGGKNDDRCASPPPSVLLASACAVTISSHIKACAF
jgi:hypothetical protein